jgi:hypothetical protein
MQRQSPPMKADVHALWSRLMSRNISLSGFIGEHWRLIGGDWRSKGF